MQVNCISMQVDFKVMDFYHHNADYYDAEIAVDTIAVEPNVEGIGDEAGPNVETIQEMAKEKTVEEHGDLMLN